MAFFVRPQGLTEDETCEFSPFGRFAHEYTTVVLNDLPQPSLESVSFGTRQPHPDLKPQGAPGD